MEKDIEETKQEIIQCLKDSGDQKASKTINVYEEHCWKTKKVNLKETFGFYRQLKDGTQGKILMFPDIE